MTDKVQKIREEVVRLQKRAEHNFDISLTENDRQFWLGESNVLTLIGNYIDTLQKEPVSEKFEKALAEEWQGYVDRGAATVDALEDNTQELAFAKGFYRGANWQKEQIAKRLCNHANIDQMVEKFEDKYKPEKVLDTEYYKRGIFDTIKAIKEG